ncbi:hypothetical protein ACHAWF_010877 [Thalassiosira exigua]
MSPSDADAAVEHHVLAPPALDPSGLAVAEAMTMNHHGEHHPDDPVAAVVGHHHLGHGGDVAAVEEAVALAEAEAVAASIKAKRVRKLPLSPHEALAYANRGIYVDPETQQLRCSCNHKPCHKWELYGYTRHFGFKVHRRYEAERLDDVEIQRLRDCKELYLRQNPVVEEPRFRKKKRSRGGEGDEGSKVLSVEELRVQERHWMEMWKEAKNELKQMRQDLKEEADEDVRAELMADIEGLKRRKGDWAKLLGLKDGAFEATATL